MAKFRFQLVFTRFYFNCGKKNSSLNLSRIAPEDEEDANEDVQETDQNEDLNEAEKAAEEAAA